MKITISRVIRGLSVLLLAILVFYSSANEPLLFKIFAFISVVSVLLILYLHYKEYRNKYYERYNNLSRKFEEIFDSVPEAIMIDDINGKIIDCNNTTIKMYGYDTKEEILNGNIGDLSAVNEEFTEEEAQKRIKKAIDEGFNRFEWLARRKNGETFWVEVQLKKIILENRPHILALVTDINQKKMLEETEKDKALKYKILFETIPVGVVYQDPEGKIIDANDKACEILGLTRDQMFGRTSFDPRWKAVYEDFTEFPGEKHPSIIALRQGIQVKDTIMGVFNPIDNRHHWIKINAIPLFKDDKTKPYMVYTVFEDVTEKRRAEKELLTTKRFLEQTGRLAKVGGWEKDLLTHEDIWSDVTKDIHEVDKDFVPDMQKGIDFYKEGEDREKIIKAVTHTIQTGEPFDVECRIITAKGNEKWVRAIGNATFENGVCRKLFGAFLDIDEIKRTEMKNLAERERLINEIQNAQRLESLGLLAGGIAHDLNNMLSSFFGVLGIVRTITNDNEIQNFLTLAEKNINRARDFTNRLIVFAKGHEPVKKIMNIDELIRQNAEFALSGSNIQLFYYSDENLSKVEIDPNQIVQVMDNIIINSKEAIEHDNGIINIHLQNAEIRQGEHPTLTPGKYIKISISDNGKGISKENLNKIFDPFFTTKANGHGLGLSISYSIIKKHGGIIEVDSEEKKGSRFTIYLPAASEEKSTRSAQSSATITEIKETSPAKKRVLLMDDEGDVRIIISRMLERLEYEVLSAQNGEEAIKIFSEEIKAGRKIDIVILDLTIQKGMGGNEAIKKLREIDNKFFAFVSSGYSDDPILSEPQKFGFDDSIRKPFTMQELKEALKKTS